MIFQKHTANAWMQSVPSSHYRHKALDPIICTSDRFPPHERSHLILTTSEVVGGHYLHLTSESIKEQNCPGDSPKVKART